MTKDRLIGMQVIDSEGNDTGSVQDIAFTVGKVGMTLIVETKKEKQRKSRGNKSRLQETSSSLSPMWRKHNLLVPNRWVCSLNSPRHQLAQRVEDH